MKTLRQLEKEGFQGIDISLDTSLFEYNLIWTKNDQCSDNEYYCIYKYDEGKFCNGYLDLDDIIQELETGWMKNFDFRYCGTTKSIMINSLRNGDMHTFYSLFTYYGYMEFFGSPDYTIYIYDEDEIELLLGNDIPHGSGIDCSYVYTMFDNRLTIENSFHCMNNNGYYDGYIDFKLIIPFDNPADFKLQFTDYKEHRNTIKKYGWSIRDYLESIYVDYINQHIDIFQL